MESGYLTILIYMGAVVFLSAAILGVSAWVGVKRPTREKLSPYECGIQPVGDARERGVELAHRTHVARHFRVVQVGQQVGERLVVARPSRLMDLAAGMHVRPVDPPPGR